MTQDDYARLEMVARSLHRRYSDEELKQAFKDRSLDEEFAQLGSMILAFPERRERHHLIWAGYEYATASPYGVLV